MDLSARAVLQTTRAVRKRLDLRRPVEPEVIKQCIEIAIQAPTGSNNQHWHFIVVTDVHQRYAIGELYRKGFAVYRELALAGQAVSMRRTAIPNREAIEKLQHSSTYLLEHIHEVPVMVVPCIEDRAEEGLVVEQANAWGSILPATWNFMLAARTYGLGTCWTTFHLYYEREAAHILNIPFEQVMQAALIPVAYTLGDTFHPATRSIKNIIHWQHW